jgi:1-acyl-sn-glycerol-3-phosphate acyltransferase
VIDPNLEPGAPGLRHFMGPILNSFILLLVLPLYTVLAGAVGIPYALATGKAGFLYWLGRLGARIGFVLARIQIVVRGKDLPENPHFIYMMNHSSNLDVPAVMINLPGEVRAFGKKELFKLPVLSTAMRIGGFVPVDRRNREAAIESVRQAVEVARGGASFLIAPEGTRSRTGKILRFKKGAFYLAIDSGVPVLPIVVRGVHELMPPGSFSIRSGKIEVVFLDPIPTAHLTLKDRARLMETVRNRIVEAYEAPSREHAVGP